MKWKEIIEGKSSGGIKPLTPAQARREANKETRTNQQITDVRDRFDRRMSELRRKLAGQP